MQIIGSEGLFGVGYMAVLLVAFQLIPGDDNGSYENTEDSLYKIKETPSLWFFIVPYTLSIAFYNSCGATITKEYS